MAARLPRRLLPATALAVALLVLPAANASGDSRFERAERARETVLSLAGTPESPAAGDVVLVEGLWIVLDSAERPDVRGREEKTLVAEETGRPVAVAIEGDGEANPLLGLSNQEAAGLRGVRVSAWSEEIARHLRRLDLERCCLTIEDGAVPEESGRLPPLPAGTRYLVLDGHRFGDLASLARLPGLRLLSAT